jgi:hypothetical protein
MTQEDKNILLKDLCARLPYGVIIAYKEGKNDYHCWTLRTLNAPGISKSDTAPDSDGEIEYTEQAGIGMRTGIRPLRLEKMLPYLRPMSSMTEEERRYLLEELGFDEDLENGELNDFGSYVYRSVNVLLLFDWLNAHHFDYRGLIPMGLALEAPEEMYKTE